VGTNNKGQLAKAKPCKTTYTFALLFRIYNPEPTGSGFAIRLLSSSVCLYYADCLAE
jgi:hypothetical protein